MTEKVELIFSWEKDVTANGYIVEQKKADNFIKLVRVENVNLTTLFINDVPKYEENVLRVNYFLNKNGKSYIYRQEQYYCFANGKSSTIYKLPYPRLTLAKKKKDEVIINWEKIKDGVMYTVIRKEAGGRWKRIGTTMETKYIDNDIDVGKKYTYTVRCISKDSQKNLSGCSLKGISV